MSQYVVAGSCFRDEECLIKAMLRAQPRWTRETIETHEEATNLYGWHGDKRADLANIIVRRQHVGSSSNDLGFQKQGDGTYTMLISKHDRNHNQYDDGWVTRLTNFYNEEKVVKECKALGYPFEIEEKNGERQLIAYVTG